MFGLTASDRANINPKADSSIHIATKLTEAKIYEKQIDFIKGELKALKESIKHYTNNAEMKAAISGQIGAYTHMLTLLVRASQ